MTASASQGLRIPSCLNTCAGLYVDHAERGRRQTDPDRSAVRQDSTVGHAAGELKKKRVDPAPSTVAGTDSAP